MTEKRHKKGKKMEKENRILKYDIARVLAILCVVLCHATETVYTFNATGWSLLSSQSRIFMMVAFTIGRLGVPIFLFLTGALILRKDINTDQDVMNFYKKNLVSLFIANSIWVIIYNFYFLLTNNSQNVTLEIVLKELFFLKQVPLPNMWYIPMIIGLYIGLPFVAKIVKTFSKKTLLLFMSTMFITSFIFPLINVICGIFNINNSFSSLLNLSFFGGSYGLYILLGYFMTSQNKIKINKLFLLLISIVSFGFTCFIQIISYSNISHCNYNVWYDFPTILICAASIFMIITNTDYSKINDNITKIISFISKASLAIFFMHIMVQRYLEPGIKSLQVIMPLKVILLFVSNIIICIVINLILNRSKFISKYVLLIKK